MTLVKIDGISDPKHARLAAAYGADFVGVIFAPSRRQVTIGQGRRIAGALGKGTPTHFAPDIAAIEEALKEVRPLFVGVFADQDAGTINSIADECGLDLVQLSGSEPWELNESLNRPILKCLKVREGESADHILSHYHGGAVLLLDAYVEGAYGGTGRTIDWKVAAEVATRTATVLAGGLTPDNVAEAVAAVHPWAVDVSSGVEINGVKDPNKIRAFIAAAKQPVAAEKE